MQLRTWILACLAMWPVWAFAQQLPPATVAVIDYQRIVSESEAAVSIRSQVDARHQRYQEQIAGEERRLHEANRELERQRSVLAPEAFATKREDFDKDVAAVQRMVQDRRLELDLVNSEAVGVMRNKIIAIIESLAEDQGFNIVLPTSGVLLFTPELDLTEEVLGRLNGELPFVKVPEKPSE